MDIKKIEKFYSMVSKEVYSEEDSELHKNMIEAVRLKTVNPLAN